MYIYALQTRYGLFLRQFLELGQILEGSRSPHRRTCRRTLFEPVRPSDTEITFPHSTVFVDLIPTRLL